jgi:hypothetical protein
MKFVTARDLRLHPAKVWQALEEETDLVVTLNGKPKAILVRSDEKDVERALSLMRRVRAQIAVAEIQRHSLRAGLDRTPARKIESIIREARKRHHG